MYLPDLLAPAPAHGHLQILAVAGFQMSSALADGRELWMVQFYNHNGALRLPAHARMPRMHGVGCGGPAGVARVPLQWGGHAAALARLPCLCCQPVLCASSVLYGGGHWAFSPSKHLPCHARARCPGAISDGLQLHT